MNPRNLGLDSAALLTGVLATASLRVLMAPYPNIEPIMLATIVTGLSFGPLAGFIMGAGSMLLSNFFLAPGPLTFPWIIMMPLVTAYTSLTYGAIGLFCGGVGLFRKSWGRFSLASLAASMTILYDAVTAACFGLQFYGPGGIYGALMAQIPFTYLHLSNALFAFILAPYLFKAAYGVREAVFRAYRVILAAFF